MSKMFSKSADSVPLRGVSLASAIRLSVVFSNKTEDEIAAEMGWSESVRVRIFSSQDYWPTLPTIHRFCRACGNSILIRWQMENLEGFDKVVPASADRVRRDMGKLFAELGEFAIQGEKSIDDGVVTPQEARRMLRELDDLMHVGATLSSALQAHLDAQKDAV